MNESDKQGEKKKKKMMIDAVKKVRKFEKCCVVCGTTGSTVKSRVTAIRDTSRCPNSWNENISADVS